MFLIIIGDKKQTDCCLSPIFYFFNWQNAFHCLSNDNSSSGGRKKEALRCFSQGIQLPQTMPSWAMMGKKMPTYFIMR